MFVSINMAMSLDGKIATKARGPVKLGSAFDSRRMAEIRAEHDVVINGASTFSAHPFPLTVKGSDLLQMRKREGRSLQPASAIVSSKLKIPRNTAWEKAKKADRWVFCGKLASKTTQASLEKSGVRVVRGRSDRPEPREILKAFSQAGFERVLLEGGGEFNASFLEMGLVNQVHLTLVPILLGGVEAPTWFEGKGFPHPPFPRFHLKDFFEKNGELYLTYGRRK